jgi:hypothetical protein
LFSIAPTGEVMQASYEPGALTQNARGATIATCVVEAVTRWQVPKVPNGHAVTRVRYPFMFHLFAER